VPFSRILIIKPSAIGDVVHTLPILNLLRRRFPRSHIAWLVTTTCAGLLQGHPQLDEVILFDRGRIGRGWWRPSGMAGFFDLCGELMRRNFSLVLDLQGLLRSGILTFATGAPRRIGFANAREGATMFYTHHVPIDTMEQHAIDRYLRMVESIGCETGPIKYIFPTDAADRSAVDAMLGNVGPFATLLPGTNWPTKRWPIDKFAAIVEPLRTRFGLRTVVAGGPGDAELARRIPADLDLTGKTNLRQLVALLERSALVIANDSGPMHIASALGRPLVVPFGPTNPIRTGPYRRMDTVLRLDLPCSPCYSRRCTHQSCLQWLGTDSILDHAKHALMGEVR
jgi:heptosyltransferase-1